MSQLKGLSYTQKLYEEHGNTERLRLWSRNIKWAILTGSSRVLYKMGKGPQTDSLVKYITDLAKTGFFDDAVGTRENIAKELYYTVAKGLRPVKTD